MTALLEQQMTGMQKAIGEILDRLTRMETILEMRSDFEERIRTLEQKMAEQRGRQTVVAVIVGLASSVMTAVASGSILWHIKG